MPPPSSPAPVIPSIQSSPMEPAKEPSSTIKVTKTTALNPLSISRQISFSSRTPSFQEKVKLPYSPSFANLQRADSTASVSTEFNRDFDPLSSLQYGSFRQPSFGNLASENNAYNLSSFSAGGYSEANQYDYPSTNYNNLNYNSSSPFWRNNYEQAGNNTYQEYYEQAPYDYEGALMYNSSNGYNTYDNYNYDPQNQNYYDEQTHSISYNSYSNENGTEYNYPQQYIPEVYGENVETSQAQTSIKMSSPISLRKNSSKPRIPIAIARKKSISNKQKSFESFPDLQPIEMEISSFKSTNIMGLAFGNSSESFENNSEQVSATKLSLKAKKASLWE
jgi:hypothetical protein